MEHDPSSGFFKLMLLFFGVPLGLGVLALLTGERPRRNKVEDNLEMQTWLMWRDRLDRYKNTKESSREQP